MKKIKILTFILLFVSCAVAGFSFEVGDAASTDVETSKGSSEKTDDAEVVVTGTKSKKLLRTSPVKTEIVTKRKIEAKGADNLFDALKGEVGCVVENNCQNCAANTVALNGLGGNYTQLLMNGSPSISSLAGVYFLQQAPASLIDRLEIVRGGGSSLYGSGAIGGVINIITKKPVKNGANIEYKHEFVDGSDSQAWTTNGDASFVSKDGRSGVIVYGSKKDSDYWDANDDHFSDLPRMRSVMTGISGFFGLTHGIELTYNFMGMEEFRRGGNKFALAPEKTDITEQIDTDRTSGDLKITHNINKNISYNIYYGFANTKRATYYGPGNPSASTDTELAENLNFNGKTNNLYQLVGGEVDYNIFKNHSLKIGYQYTDDDVEDINTGVNRNNENKYNNHGLFAQYNADFKIIEIILGVRSDKHSELDDYIISPRASAIFKPNKNIRWRGTVSTGFLAPQVFDEDYHIEVGLAGNSTTQNVIVNSEDLTEEKSVSYSTDMGINYGVGDLDIDLNIGGFYTEIKKAMYIDYDNPVVDGSIESYYRKNADGKTNVYGGTLEILIEYDKLLIWSNTLTIQRADMPGDGDEFMNKMPKQHAYSMLQILLGGFETGITAQYLGKTNVFKEDEGADGEFVETDSFWVYGVQLKYSFAQDSRKITLYGGIDNITNAYQDDLGEGTDRPAGYLYGPTKPRTYFLGCKLGF
jgi:outer membrane receptor for ferrienterochelin and colicins